ncbi:MAG: type II toxin-antitoxin system Phd/YefM family antitoxin [Clostridiales bacterium]|jgi:antitoxin Phd|nr:type II toxin-antitoxin system Phd/YefM family antitoxin [Clostridiales bacterium]
MRIDTNSIVSITEANRNFSRVARLVDETGAVAILKNNAPRYLLIEFSGAQAAPDEDVTLVARRVIENNREAFEALARGQ